MASSRGLFLAWQLRKLQSMGTDKALASVFHSPEPAASDFEALPLLLRSHFHRAWVPGQEAATTHRAEARPASCLYEPTSAKSMGAKKNPTAVISSDKQSESSAANQRANLCAASLGCLLPPSVVLAEMESSTRITSVSQGCTKTGRGTRIWSHASCRTRGQEMRCCEPTR